MSYQNSLNIAQPAFHPGFGQDLTRRRATDLPGGSSLWWAASKIAVLIATLALGLNLCLGFAVTKAHENMLTISEQQHLLKDEQMTLLAERANLMSERQVQLQAAIKLALFVPEQEQVLRLR